MHIVSSYLTVGARSSKDVRMINTSSSASESNTIFQILLASNHQMVRAADTAIKLLLAPLSLMIRATDDDNQAVNDEHYNRHCGDVDDHHLVKEGILGTLQLSGHGNRD